MPNIFQHFVKRIKLSPGREYEQASIRLIIGFSVFIYTIYLNRAHPEIILSVSAEIVLYTLAAIILFFWIYKKPFKTPLRYIISSIIDITGLSYAMYLGDASGAALYALFLWVIFGYGFRFGRRYLTLTVVESLIGFVFVYFSSNYWQQHQLLFAGLLVGLILLPMYVSNLLKHLEKSIEEAKVANQAKTKFLSNMSHELRTPLNGICGSNDLLKGSVLTSEQRKYVNTIDYSVTTLLELIENILDFSKIESGKEEILHVRFDLHHLLNTTTQILRHHALKKNLTLKVEIEADVPYIVTGDNKHTRQILVNLIGNAIKYTNEGSVTIKVSLKEIENNTGRILFEIIDTGIGIKKEKLSNIFDRFTQVDDSDTRTGEGSGLGTAIAKDVIKKLDGEIGVQSEFGEGSVFWFEIPYELELLDYENNSDLKGMNTLLLGEAYSEDLLETLSGWELNFFRVKDKSQVINESVEISANNIIHAIIVAGHSIGMNEIQLVEKLRSKDEINNIPIILVADNIDPIMKNELRTAGCSYILSSSMDKMMLFNAIHSSSSILDQADETEVVSSAENNSKDKNYKILLAEDFDINQELFKTMLVNGGHSVTITSNGQELLDELEKNTYDLCLVDMQMPVMGGVQAIKIYKEKNPESELPFIMLTANATVDAVEKCKDVGVNIYLTKPIRSAELLKAVNSIH